MERIILSICIPTFNRIEVLKELIDSLLTIERDDFEIVITDNCSTDNTKTIVKKYIDKRIRYILNEKPIPALLNVIRSIFNANGKYALYCNDRDILYPSRINKFIDLIKDEDLSFIMCPRKSKYNENLDIYDKGYDSLIHQDCIHHPTGMVFNCDLIKQHLKEEKYQQYLDVVNTYDFLMLDLLKYEKSAICNLGYWGTRNIEFIRNNKAGTGNNLYFMPENRERTFYKIVKHIYWENEYGLTKEQMKFLGRKIYLFFAILFCNYKLCLSDRNESAHYGMDKKNISSYKMLKICNSFFEKSIIKIHEYINDESIIWYLKKQKSQFLKKVIICCVKIDVLSIYKLISI